MATFKDKISAANWHPEIDILINFSEGSLSDETNDLLKTHIENCEICQRTLLGMETSLMSGDKEILKTASDNRADRAYQKFSQDKKAIKNSPKPRRILAFISIPALAAASIALLFFIRGFQISYIPEDIPHIDYDKISRTTATDFEQGITKYNEEQFEIARSLFLSADTIASAYYLGLIELREGTNPLEEARSHFENSYKNTTGKQQANAAFYLAQIFYKQKDYKKSKQMTEALKKYPELFSNKNIQKIYSKLKDQD